MEKHYVAPELKLAGDADKVVLGLSGPGIDFLVKNMGNEDVEFAADDESTST